MANGPDWSRLSLSLRMHCVERLQSMVSQAGGGVGDPVAIQNELAKYETAVRERIVSVQSELQSMVERQRPVAGEALGEDGAGAIDTPGAGLAGGDESKPQDQPSV